MRKTSEVIYRSSKIVKKSSTPESVIKILKCSRCKEIFKQKSSCDKHKCWANCSFCLVTFTPKDQSMKHMKQNHNFRCRKCPHISALLGNLEAHCDYEHSHFCDKSGSVFDSEMDMDEDDKEMLDSNRMRMKHSNMGENLPLTIVVIFTLTVMVSNIWYPIYLGSVPKSLQVLKSKTIL